MKILADILGEELPVRMKAQTYHKDKGEWTQHVVTDKIRGVSRKHILDKAIKKIQKAHPNEKEHEATIVKELYEPEPKGEKKFVAKHKAELSEPAKKLDDKIFKASTKKASYKEAPKVYENKINEGLRLLKTHTEGSHTAKVYKDHEWGEHRVKFYTDGKYLGDKADYHTDDKEDAHDTAKAELKRMSKNKE